MFETLSPAGVLAAALIAPPSAELIVALAALDAGQLDAGLQVDLMVAWERVTAWVMACQLPVVAAVGEVAYAAAAEAMKGSAYSAEMPFRASHAEIGCAMRLSEQGGERRLAMARRITGVLPAVYAALLDGDISYRHAEAFAEATEELSDDADACWVAARVLPRARRQTVAELRRALRRAVLAVDPTSAADRHVAAVAERKVIWFDLPDGMGELRLTAGASDVKAVYNAIDAAAKSMPKRAAEGARIPIDTRRADALVAMVTGLSGGVAGGGSASGGRPSASIQVTIDLPTLLGLADNPAELAGYGPIPAPLARALSADGKWRRLICDPLTGALIDLGTSSYTPNRELERYIRSRDARCAFPGCNQPAHRCDIDHTKPYQAGDPSTGTDRCNLGVLCEGHHRLKHEAGWQLSRDPDDHTGTWTSPTGHEYPTRHHDHRAMNGRDKPDGPKDDTDLCWSDGISLDEAQWLYADDPDWDHFVASTQTPPDLTAAEPRFDPHEDYEFGVADSLRSPAGSAVASGI